jgi:hypothetical protein
MDPDLRSAICAAVLEDPRIAGVFYDLTHKPQGTIEWGQRSSARRGARQSSA